MKSELTCGSAGWAWAFTPCGLVGKHPNRGSNSPRGRESSSLAHSLRCPKYRHCLESSFTQTKRQQLTLGRGHLHQAIKLGTALSWIGLAWFSRPPLRRAAYDDVSAVKLVLGDPQDAAGLTSDVSCTARAQTRPA